MKRLLRSLFLILSVLVSTSAYATTFYVSPTGTGTACTSAAPCSFQGALTTAAYSTLDNSIYMAAGTYTSAAGFVFLNPDVIPDHDLTIVGAGQGSTFITATAGDGLSITMSGDLRISGITFKNSSGRGLRSVDDTVGSGFNTTVYNCTFSGNAGGGADIQNGYLTGSITIANNIFQDNTSGGIGTGLNMVAGTSPIPVTIKDNLFKNNVGGDSGAGLYVVTYGPGEPITLTGNTFDSNTNNGGAFTNGSGAFLTSGSDQLITVGGPNAEDANIFTNNSGGANGGGVGLYIFHAAFGVTVQGNTFTNNTASGGEGGGAKIIYLGGPGVFSNNIVQNNSASSNGGFQMAINTPGSATTSMTVNGNLVSGNTSTDVSGVGGASVVLYEMQSPAVITNNIIVNNSAGDTGGSAAAGGLGIFSNSSQSKDVEVINNTFANNSCDGNECGGGLFINSDNAAVNLNVYNNIFWQNSTTEPSWPQNDLRVFGTMNGLVLSNNDITSVCYDPGSGTICSDGSDFSTLPDTTVTSLLYNTNPLFVGTGDDLVAYYSLQATSPVIAQGDEDAPSIPDTDYDDVEMDFPPDLGALQYISSDFSVNIMNGPLQVAVDQNYSWTVTITSAEDAPTGTLTAVLSATNQTIGLVSGDDVSCTGTGPVTCAVPNVPAGESASFTVLTMVEATPITLTADVTDRFGVTKTAVGSTPAGCSLNKTSGGDKTFLISMMMPGLILLMTRLKNSRAELLALSQQLLKLHKSLLDFQKQIQGKKERKNFAPNELLHLVMNHPDFAWLRKLSTLIVRIDEQLDDKEASLDDFHKEVTKELAPLLNDAGSSSDFNSRLEAALKESPDICLQVAELKKSL